LNSIQIDTKKLELQSNVILDHHTVENVILNLANTTLCLGTLIPNQLVKYKPNTGYTDCNGKFHHSKCLIVIKMSSHNNYKLEKCKSCVTLISTCIRKKK